MWCGHLPWVAHVLEALLVLVTVLVADTHRVQRAVSQGRHISLIVSSKGAIWGDDSEDLRFIVLHVELRSQQGALDIFLSLMTGATLKCKQFSCAKGEKLRSTEWPPTLY